jgi:hypothetical protein
MSDFSHRVTNLPPPQAIAIKGKQIEQTNPQALAETVVQIESLPEEEAPGIVAVVKTGNAQEIAGAENGCLAHSNVGERS